MRILLIDDNTDLAALWAEYLSARGHTVRTGGSVADAQQLLDRGFQPQVAIIDWSLPDGTGEEVLELLAVGHPITRAILCSGHGHALPPRAKARAVAVLSKPFRLQQLTHQLELALRSDPE